MKAMPSKLLSEWVAFFQIEREEEEKASLPQKASIGEKALRMKRDLAKGK